MINTLKSIPIFVDIRQISTARTRARSFLIPALSSSSHRRTTHHKHISDQNEKHLVKRVQHSVKPFGYLELSNVDVDLKIKPADPDQFPNMDGAIISLYTNDITEKQVPVLVQSGNMMTFQSPKSYKPNESSCLLEIPIKYGNNKLKLYHVNILLWVSCKQLILYFYI